MQAQGITKKDYVAAEVQKAYAEGLGQMGSGGGGGGSAMSDVIGLGVGLKAAGVMAGQLGNVFDGIGGTAQTQQTPVQPQQPAPAPADDMAAFKAKVEKLAVMKESGLITEEEFAQMKAKLLSDIMG